MLFSPQIVARSRVFVGGGGGGGGGSDPNFASVKLLAGMNGTNGSTMVPDESGAAHGNASAINCSLDTSQFQFGPSSLNLGGSVSAAQWAASADWALGSGSFTIEGWIRTTSVGGAGVSVIISLFDANSAFSFYWARSGSTLVWNVSTTGADNIRDITTASILSTNTWYAAGMDFDGSKYRMYLDGTMVGSFSTPRTLFNASSAPLSIGATGEAIPGSNWVGFIDEVRLTKGVARYASDSGYTVATAVFPRS